MIAATKRKIPSKQTSGWASAVAGAFGRRQQSKTKMLFIMIFIAWEYFNQPIPYPDSRIAFYSVSRTLDEMNVTTIDATKTTTADTAKSAAISASTPIEELNKNITVVDNDLSTSQALFSTWKAKSKVYFRREIREIKKKQRKSRKYNHKLARYEELLQRIEQVEDWGSDPSSWITVSSQAFQDTVQQAQAEITPLVEQVHADCTVWIVPFKGKTGQRGVYKIKPKIRFQCDKHDATSKMQDDPCSGANFCLVQTDLRRWKFNESQIPYNVSLPNLTYNEYTGQHDKSALLTVVDSTEYLYGNRIWSCFLNKASFSLLTKRPFFIWIGKIDEEILQRRNTEVVKRNFGATCAPFGQAKNAVNYYKPVAFAALFRRQQFVHVETAYFLDADMYFNTQVEFFNATQHHLEDYFDLSPQASLVGSQNPSGKGYNILLNGGFLGLRRSEWIDNFAALWWFCRCGEKDQTALWLTLFAHWSAVSHSMEGQTSFSYPGTIFENYDFAWYAVMPHSRTYFGELQQGWQARQKLADNDATKNNDKILSVERPQSDHQFDGGGDFLQATTAPSDLFTAPLELPKVLLLPLHSFRLQTEQSDSTDAYPPLVSKMRKDAGDEGALLIHNKFPHYTCSDQQCWPFRA